MGFSQATWAPWERARRVIFKQNFKAIYAAVEKGDTAKGLFANFDDGLREMELCDAVVRSAAERRWVKVEG